MESISLSDNNHFCAKRFRGCRTHLTIHSQKNYHDVALKCSKNAARSCWINERDISSCNAINEVIVSVQWANWIHDRKESRTPQFNRHDWLRLVDAHSSCVESFQTSFIDFSHRFCWPLISFCKMSSSRQPIWLRHNVARHFDNFSANRWRYNITQCLCRFSETFAMFTRSKYDTCVIIHDTKLFCTQLTFLQTNIK